MNLLFEPYCVCCVYPGVSTGLCRPPCLTSLPPTLGLQTHHNAQLSMSTGNPNLGWHSRHFILPTSKLYYF